MMIRLVVLLAFVALCRSTPCTSNATYCENRPSGNCYWIDVNIWNFCNGTYPSLPDHDVLISPGSYILTSNVTFNVRSLTVNPNLGVVFNSPFTINATFTALPSSVIEIDVPVGLDFYLGEAAIMRNVSFTWNTGNLIESKKFDASINVYGTSIFSVGVGLKTLSRSINFSPESELVFQDGSILTIDAVQIKASNINLGGSVVITLKQNYTTKISPTIITGDLHLYAPNKNVAIGVPLQADLLSIEGGGLTLTEEFFITQINVQAGTTLTVKEGPGVNSSYNVLTNNGNIDLEYGCDDQTSSLRSFFPQGSILNYGDAVLCAQYDSGFITNNGTMRLLDQFAMNVSVINNFGNLTISGAAYFIDSSVTNYGHILGSGFVVATGNGTSFDWQQGDIYPSIDVTNIKVIQQVNFYGQEFIVRGSSFVSFLNLSANSSIIIQSTGNMNLTGYVLGGNSTKLIHNQGTLTGTGEIFGTLVNAGLLLDADFDVWTLICENSSLIIYNVNSATNENYLDIDGASYLAGYFIVNINTMIKDADNMLPFIVVSNTSNTTGTLNTTFNINFDLESSTQCSYQINSYKLDGGCSGAAASSTLTSSSSNPKRTNGGAIAAGILVPLFVIAIFAGGFYWYKRRGGARAEYRKL